MEYVNNSFTFLKHVMSNFSLMPIVCHQFFTCVALVDVDLCCSLIFVPKANAKEGGIKRGACSYHQSNQPIHVTDGVQ